MANRLNNIDASAFRNNTYTQDVVIVSVVAGVEYPFDLTGLDIKLMYVSGDAFIEIPNAVTARDDPNGTVQITVPVSHPTAMWRSTEYRLDTINSDGEILTKTAWKVLRK